MLISPATRALIDAVLETAAGLELFDNLQIRAGGKLFCKVTDKTDTGCKVQYTAIPAGYEEWLQKFTS